MEKSIPLYRFLGGKTEENVIFAVKGTSIGEVNLMKLLSNEKIPENFA